MNEREALLAAIRANPADDTPRLVYADWLDENPERGDLDRATAEFIRMSCARPGAKVMPRAVYPWLLSKGLDGHVVENWKRFLPALLKIDRDNSPFGQDAIGRREGRMIRCAVRVTDEPARSYAATFEFHRGFVSSFTVSSAVAARAAYPAVVRDQPLVSLHVAGLFAGVQPGHDEIARELTALVEKHQGADAGARFAKRAWLYQLPPG